MKTIKKRKVTEQNRKFQLNFNVEGDKETVDAINALLEKCDIEVTIDLKDVEKLSRSVSRTSIMEAPDKRH